MDNFSIIYFVLTYFSGDVFVLLCCIIEIVPSVQAKQFSVDCNCFLESIWFQSAVDVVSCRTWRIMTDFVICTRIYWARLLCRCAALVPPIVVCDWLLRAHYQDVVNTAPWTWAVPAKRNDAKGEINDVTKLKVLNANVFKCWFLK